jgi:hypothetical protein
MVKRPHLCGTRAHIQAAGDYPKRTDVRLVLSVVDEVARSRTKIGDALREFELALVEPMATSPVDSEHAAVAAAAMPCIEDGDCRRAGSKVGSGAGAGTGAGTGWFGALARLGSARSAKATPE